MSNRTRKGSNFTDEDSTQKTAVVKKPADFGNTLDYYNDDLSRKAVGKLFGDVKSTDTYGSHGESDDPNDPNDEPPEKDEDIVRGFEKEPAPRGRNTTYQRSHNEDDYEDDEVEGYNFSLYRKKERRDSGWASYDDRSEQSEAEQMKEQKTPKREPVKIERPVRVPYQNAVKTPSTQKPKTTKPKTLYRNDYIDDDSDNYSHSPLQQLPTRLMVFGGIILVSVLLLATLVFQLNSTKAKLKTANEKVVEFDDISQQKGTLAMQNETLTAQVEALQKQLAEAEAKIAESEPAPADPDAQGAVPAASGTTPSANGLPTTYTVVSGDNLGKISQKYYGDTGGVQKIQEANSLTDTNISIGQVLKIPK